MGHQQGLEPVSATPSYIPFVTTYTLETSKSDQRHLAAEFGTGRRRFYLSFLHLSKEDTLRRLPAIASLGGLAFAARVLEKSAHRTRPTSLGAAPRRSGWHCHNVCPTYFPCSA
jgi:hypothetical protein